MPDFLPVRGRKPDAPAAAVVRELDHEDLQALQVQGSTQSPAITKLRSAHHALARALAQGVKPAEAAAITGYSSSRIAILQADPTFQDLVELYRDDVNAQYLDFHGQLANLASDATSVLQERLEDDPDSVDTRDLLKAIELGADRTGFGPQSKSTNTNINVDISPRLQSARLRIAALAPPGGTASTEEPGA